jgi:Protein kinase domain/Pentapeptide repeats (8 copies)
MSDPKHLRFLISSSYEELRAWRKNNPKDVLDLIGADLSLADMSDAPLAGMADFSLADLSRATLRRADLSEVTFTRANMTDVDLRGAILILADMARVDLRGSDLRGADLSFANLERGNLAHADLTGANLEGADLMEANLAKAKLNGANLTKVICGGTIFADADLSGSRGLETVVHYSPSMVGLDTLERSGNIPVTFLEGCGVPHRLIVRVLGDYRRGQTVGGWTLADFVAKGGNGEVWEAKNAEGTPVAVKILKSLDARSDTYKRFRSEIEVLRLLGPHDGILPLIDACSPDAPSHHHPAWLAMPFATGIEEALELAGEWRLKRVIEAIARIAETLAKLHALGISHRDIKPANLFWYKGDWVVGDFGLVDFPDKAAVTKQGRKLGPQYYIAPEMLLTPETADGKPADVYSLAKTLWVLATDQRFPPPGEQRRDLTPILIGNYVSSPGTGELDTIAEAATRHDPIARPQMSEVASDLRAWLSRRFSADEKS